MELHEGPSLSLDRATMPADVRALVERARRGDAAAERRLYDLHVDRVYRLTFRLTGRDDVAREMTQDTFVRAFQRLAEFRGDASFGTWLHTIAVSLSLNEIRRRKRVSAREGPLTEAADVVGRQPIGDPILRDRLAQAIATLPERQRTVFVMHVAEGFTHEEIATTLGVTQGTTKAQVFAARAKLRELLAGFAEEWRS